MIADLQALLRDKQLSCVELTRIYLSEIQNNNKKQNSYITLTPEIALADAAQVDKRLAARETLRPLEGVPMTLKDNIAVAGVQMSCASRMLCGYHPPYDATVWQLLREQGAILLGKSNMDEFAMGSSGETSCFGGTPNPRNAAYVTGGSSSGGVGAVGSGQTAFAIGTDTGGSIRQPAAFCGLVGVKPTYGAISRYGMVAHASSLDQPGPIAGCVADAALVLNAIAQRDQRDATSRGLSRLHPLSAGRIDGLLIGLPEQAFVDLEPEVQASLEQSIAVLTQMGAKMIPLSMPLLQHALPAYFILSCAESASNLSRFDFIRYQSSESFLMQHPSPLFDKKLICTHKDFKKSSNWAEQISRYRSERFGAEVQRRILLGNYVLRSGYYDAYYQKAQILRQSLRACFDEIMTRCDLLLTPTSPTTAFLRGQPNDDPTKDDQRDICTVSANLTGLPAVSVPCGVDQKGLPVGMQLIGRAFGEQQLLNAAHAFEQETGGAFSRFPQALGLPGREGCTCPTR